jgi:hypothetical protein
MILGATQNRAIYIIAFLCIFVYIPLSIIRCEELFKSSINSTKDAGFETKIVSTCDRDSSVIKYYLQNTPGTFLLL